MVKGWIILGLIGWVALIAYRLYTEGEPKNINLISYARGFILALILGPMCFVFLGYLFLKGENND